MWDQFNNTYNHSSGETRFMDQDILRHINKKFPDEVSLLPLEYANALARVWKLKKNFVQHRPKVGMIHFNGGGFSKDVFWNNSGMMNLYPDTFGLPFYYIRMPWEWAKYFVEGHLGNGEGKDLIIRHDHNSHM